MEQSLARTSKNEIVPKYSSFVRGRLPKTESSLTYADYLKALGAYKPGDETQTTIYYKKVIPKLALFGYLPPSILPLLLQFTYAQDKKTTLRLQRLVNYVVRVIVGDGSAGTTLPSMGVPSEMPLVKAVDTFALDSLEPVWEHASNDKPARYHRKVASLKALAAASRAVQTSKPEDVTLMRALNEALYGVLDQTGSGGGFRKAKRRRTKSDFANQFEKLGLQRVAFLAARVGLSASSLKKVAPLCFSGVSSQDPIGARHALALATLLAEKDPRGCAQQLEPSLQQNIDAFQATGSLTNVMLVRLPLQDGPLALNLADQWARVYLARACGTILHSSPISGDVEGRGELYWNTLLVLACCDASELVALEAIRAILGSTRFQLTSLRNAEAPKKLEARHKVDEAWEAENSQRLARGWKLICRHGDEPAPVPPALPQQDAAGGSKGIRKSASSGEGLGGKMVASVRKSASTGAVDNPFAVPGGDNPFAAPGENPFASQPEEPEKEKEKAPPPPPTPPVVERPKDTVLEAVVKRLLRWSMSGLASACSVSRTVAIMAEGRAHAVAAHTATAALGPMPVQQAMEQLQIRMAAIVREPLAPQLRQLAASALVWLHLPNRPPPVPPSTILQSLTKAGVPLVPGSFTFLAPWPEDCVSALLHTLQRRIAAAPETADYILQLANAAVAACPSRVNEEQLQQLWDTAVATDIPHVSLAVLRSVLELLQAHNTPITQPPSSAPPAVKAAAASEEARLSALARLAAFWLGENANYATDEYVWANKPPPPPAFHASADVSDQEKMAVAAAVQNPMLASVISNLQRAILTCTWEVRSAAAAAVAKIGVRSGEPYRIQCYSLLAATRAEGGDPLGLAAVVEPALQVLDDMYAGEVVYDSLLLHHGADTSDWPDNLVSAVVARHNHLCRAASERVGFMPKDVFYPLGARSRQLLSGEPESPYKRAGPKPEIPEPELESSTTAPAGPALELTALDMDFLKNFQLEAPDETSPDTPTALSPKKEGGANPLAAILGANFSEYFGQGGAAQSSDEDDDTPSLPPSSQVGEFGRASSRELEEEEEVLKGEVMYDFVAEAAEEVSVTQGEEVEVKYEMGGWLYVVTPGGYKGLVPSSYVKLPHDVESYPTQAPPIEPEPESPPSTFLNPPAISTSPYGYNADAEGHDSDSSTPPLRANISFSPSALAGAVSAGPGFGGQLAPSGNSGAWGTRDAVVMFDFEAEGEGEVSVKVGQQVTVAGEVDGWVQVVRADGEQGLVPASYVEFTM